MNEIMKCLYFPTEPIIFLRLGLEYVSPLLICLLDDKITLILSTYLVLTSLINVTMIDI